MAVELATRYPERVARMVLVNPVGLYLPEAPIAELFGRSPAELAEMLFVDQQHPVAAAMHAMEEFTGDVGKQVEIPIELVLPMWKALGATARLPRARDVCRPTSTSTSRHCRPRPRSTAARRTPIR